jgi:RND family efflux transporter MFP subunit
MAYAGVAEVKVHLGYLAITAPSDGIIARKMIEEGDMASPGMPLVILENTDLMKVVAHVGEKDVAAIRAGAPVTVDVTSLEGAVFETTLDRVVPAANPGSRTYDIEAHVDNADGRLKSGMFARVSVPVGERPAVLVPAEAVFRRGQLTGVWVVGTEGRAHLRWIRVGHRHGEAVEVLSGLDGDETVVLSTAETLTEGDRVVN